MIYLNATMRLFFSTGPADLSIDLSITPGSLVGLYGPSGSGKTTLLRLLAGLVLPEMGRITVGEAVWLDTARQVVLPVQQRQVGMVFQDNALFPHMTVRENIQYAAGRRRAVEGQMLIDRVGLSDLADRKPATLSGGQRQRVALVRALVRCPRLLLLDEPFSALDRSTREQLLVELECLHREFGTTTILVSHQKEDILRVADRLVYLEQGQIREEYQLKHVDEVMGEAISPIGVIHKTFSNQSSVVRIQLNGTLISVPLSAVDGVEGKVGDLVFFSNEGKLIVKDKNA